MELNLTVKGIGNQLPKIITIALDGKIVTQKELIGKETFLLDGEQIVVSIKNGYLSKRGMWWYIFLMLLSIVTQTLSGTGRILYVNEATIMNPRKIINIVYDQNSTGSIFTSPDNSATIQYTEYSTKKRIRYYKIFNWLLFIVLSVGFDYMLILTIISRTALITMFTISILVELLISLLISTRIKKARALLR